MFSALLFVALSVTSGLTRNVIDSGALLAGSRIVGGAETTIEKRPYQVSVEYLTSHFCGGALLNPDTVLSAAHCVDVAPSQENLYVRAGSTYSNSGGVRVHVSKAYPHPEYDSKTIENDIAVLKLATALTLSATISTIPILPPFPRILEGQKVVVSGWGVLHEGEVTAALVLREVELEVIEMGTCRAWYSSVHAVTDHMLCAGVPEGGRDACQGDSGGPLVTADDTQLIGVVSWGYGCARPGYPGVYARAQDYIDWITNYL